jgi:hypothetical protein
MIVYPRSPHSSCADVIRREVGVVGELSVAKSSHPILSRDLSVNQLAYLSGATKGAFAHVCPQGLLWFIRRISGFLL